MLGPKMKSLLIFEELEAVLFDTHNKRRVFIALIIVHNFIKLLLQLQACGIHLKETLSQFLWFNNLGFAFLLSKLDQLHLFLAKVLVDVQVSVVMVLFLERKQSVELGHLLGALLICRPRQSLSTFLLRLEHLLELILALLDVLVVAILEA